MDVEALTVIMTLLRRLTNIASFRRRQKGDLSVGNDQTSARLNPSLSPPPPSNLFQTEPYMPEYMNLNMNSAIEEAGFELLEVRNTSPSHIAIVARKL